MSLVPKAIAALMLFGVVSCTCLAQEIGLQLYSLRNQFAKDAAGTMARVKDMGVKEIELSGTYGLDFPEFIKIIAENELTVVSFGTEFEKLRDFPQAVADEARSYGAKYVVCSWIPHEDGSFTSSDVDRAAEVFNDAGKIMARNGLLLCYHPHGYEFKVEGDSTIFNYVMKKFDTRFVQFEMDVFWLKQAGQDPIELLKKYRSRWVLMHLKDRKRGTPDSHDGHADDESNVVLGDGDVGISEIMAEAKRMGIQHFFIEDESSRAEQQIPKSLNFLKALE
ncbi:MAG TPA: sugar phosphate isomerase/epimerase [Chryseolinea sp.]|nr:sugar phosphate isomerase/epimerase [Chryseolinea sp.]